MSRPRPVEKMVSYRKYGSIDIDGFCDDIRNSPFFTDPADTVDTLVEQYESVLTDIVDKHAPLKSKRFVQRDKVPWYNKDIQQAKRDRRRWERTWNRTGLVVHQQLYQQARNSVGDSIDKAKSEYYNGKITECNGNQRTIFKVVDSVLHRRSIVLPTCSSNNESARNFGEFFRDKITRIRDNLESQSVDNIVGVSDDEDVAPDVTFQTFHPVTEEQVHKVLSSLSSATCALDPLPTTLLKKCADTLESCHHRDSQSLTKNWRLSNKFEICQG